jgi:phosphatidylserine/phosphatidylglycerophosphate/cardiolipin synthase-like enzyme
LAPSWIEDLAQAIGKITDAQLLGLETDLERGAPLNADTLRRLGLLTGEAVQIARRLTFLTAANGAPTGRDVAIAVEAIRVGRALLQRGPEVQIVCTAPFGPKVPVRTTFATSIEMIRTAKREIVVVGYLFTEGAKQVLQELAAVGRAQAVAITLVGNRLTEQLALLKSIWDGQTYRPKLLSREADPNDTLATLHAKLLVCDRYDALITSANLSSHGLHHNIEIGIRVRSAEMGSLVDFVQSMAHTGELKVVTWNA